jgi:hypothetical protein
VKLNKRVPVYVILCNMATNKSQPAKPNYTGSLADYKASVAKPKSQTAPPPIQGPPGPGQYRMNYMQSGNWQSSLAGRNISWSGSNAGAGMGGVTPRAGGGPLNRGK